jgi:putative membrane-bound dehydrogenase-like protein
MEFPEAAQLAQTDVLVIYAADGMKIAGEQRAEVEKFLRRGGRLVVIHDGVVSGDQNEWCKSIIGGAWRWPSSGLPRERATKWYEGNVGVYWVDQEHPISRGISNFDWLDEIYYDLDMTAEVGVLATSFHNVHVIAPQIWTYEKTLTGGAAPYRAFVSLPGHEFDVFNSPQYRVVLLRGIAWAGKRANLDEFCSPAELAALRYPPGGPRPAQEAMKAFNLHPEFNLSLAADETVAEKIMSLDWDPRGRLWVVETPEYPGGRDIHRNDERIAPWRDRQPDKFPVGGKESRKARDRISILEDTNGDGVMDKKTVFADGFELPTSLVFYKDGVIISQAPDTYWVRDTDGDGKADKVEVLFTGWGTFDTHAVTSNLRWGPDGWIYGSVGYSAGDVTSGDKTRKFGRITAGLYRFRPDGSQLEQVASGSCNTWGCEIAPDGEIFFSTATCGEPILHVVLPEQTVSRAGLPGLRAAKPIIAENKVFPARKETRQPYVQIDWVGAFTAAAGACIYDGGAWPTRWQGPPWSFFVSDPTVWLTHHEFLDPAGVTYQGRREEGRKEAHFLTSTDYWFKPVHSRVGPDGALYLVDMYNQIATHNDTRGPAHGARNAATRPDRDHHFTRLYRIQHKEARPLPAFDLDPKSPAKLIAMLDHPNGWVRGTANRLLSEGAGRDAQAQLETAAAAVRTAYGRMEALWVLQNLDLLTDDLMMAAMRDSDAVVRKNALRIAAARDNSRVDPPVDLARQLLADSDQRVRVAALIATETLTPNAALAEVLVAAWPTFRDPYLEAAALAVTARNPGLYLTAALDADQSAKVAALIPQLARQLAGANDPAAVQALVIALTRKPASADPLKALVLQSLAANLRPEVKPATDASLQAALRQLLVADATAGATLPLVVRWGFATELSDAIKPAIAAAEVRLADKSVADEERAQVVANLLGVRALDPRIVPVVAALATNDASLGLKRRVIEALGTTGDKAAGAALLAAMPRLPFDLREAAFGQLIRRSDWSDALVDALAARQLDPATLGLVNLFRLRTHSDEEVAKRATKVLAELRGPEQQEKDVVIAKLRADVIKAGNVANGAKLFTQNCAGCHKFKNEGADFAPNLTGMGAHGPEDLLTHLIDPNRVVEPNFYTVSIETKDELSYDGIVLRENDAVVVVRNQTGEYEVRKNDIQSRRSNSRSLMPDGFEQMGAENLRDLLTFICADELRFRILDLSSAFTANSTRGLFQTAQARDETLRFRTWGTLKHGDVPFDAVSPQRTAEGRNLIVLQGGSGLARSYPREVEVKVGLTVTKLHFLGGVAGWGYPLGRSNAPAAKVTVHFAGGATEEMVFRNGVEFADYNSRVDVPGSVALANLDQLLQGNRQIRYFAKPLSQPGRVEKLTIASYASEVAPVFVGITAEVSDAPASAATAPALQWGAGVKTLIFGGGASHDYERWFNQADVKMLNDTGRISANYTEPVGDFAAAIAAADVLIISNNKPFSDAATRAAIFGHLKAGKGIIGLHPGLWYNWRDWPEFNRQLVGGGSRGHDRLGEFEVVVTEPGHALMRGVPTPFKIKDELYWFEPDTQGPPIKVLATAHSAQKNKPYPQVFTVEHPQARVVGLTLGHDGDAHNHPAYIRLLRNAVLWAAGKETN